MSEPPFVVYLSMYCPSFSNLCLVLVSCADHIQHGQEILDSLAEIKISIMTRYDQWRADHSSIQSSDSGLPVATSTSEFSGLIAGHLQMPLQSTWCVVHILLHALSILKELNHRHHPERPFETFQT